MREKPNAKRKHQHRNAGFWPSAALVPAEKRKLVLRDVQTSMLWIDYIARNSSTSARVLQAFRTL
jgi:hypothetical protein